MSEAAAADTLCEVNWRKSWSDRPLHDAVTCRHPASEALTINQRLVPHRSGRRIALDGSICMDCGTDTTGNLSLRDGLALCFEEHGWNRHVVDRLHELVASLEKPLYEENDRLPLWFAYAWGWDWPRIKASLEAAAA